ncbi:alpha/beta hydrolase [Lusitaniella coriacea]|uniref:alpha/beta hydrolase n=1 Tax=Lusitaniella coriacea TaxID=1983105 RepID=UPI003CECA151
MQEVKKHPHRWQSLLAVASVLGLAYLSVFLFLLVWQRRLIYRPQPELSMLPSASDFNLPYEDVWMPIAGSQERLHGWWIPSASPQEKFSVVSDEPRQILKSPKVMLYLCGVGRNMGDYNYLARVAAFRQLGFSVLVFDYRGYGRSQGNFPKESQLYEDSQSAWNYLRNVRNIPPEQILIYGESLGGAIALDLAVKHPEASGLILQSSFTSMAKAVRQKAFSRVIPVDLILSERFDSLSKISSLKVPVLFLHGSADSVVPPEMSQQLYAVAPEPKHFLLIDGAEHVRIYQPGKDSYLKAIQRFVESLN